MKKIILIGILFFAVMSLYGQNSTDSIQITTMRFLQNGKTLSARKLSAIMKTNPDANIEMEIARRNLNISIPFAIVGIPTMFFTLFYYVYKGEFNWTSAGISVGFLTAYTCIASGYNKHAKKAITIYNNGLKFTKTSNVNYQIMFANNGIGLKIVF